jgi:hypothetical protein
MVKVDTEAGQQGNGCIGVMLAMHQAKSATTSLPPASVTTNTLLLPPRVWTWRACLFNQIVCSSDRHSKPSRRSAEASSRGDG